MIDRFSSFVLSILVVLVALAASVALPVVAEAGAAGGPKPRYFVDETKLPFDALPGLPSDRFWGVHRGAGFRIEAPEDWNGALVLWAHGFRGPVLELTVDDHPLRPWLLANGFAWAATSFAKNDYDVAQAVHDVHALLGLARTRVGRPDRVYATGASMGGHVTAVAIEQWPQEFDGALPICGVLGDHELFDFFLDVNVVGQALAGVDAGFPVDEDYLDVDVPAIRDALGAFPGSFPFVLSPAGEQFRAVLARQAGGPTPLSDQAFAFWLGFAGDFLFELGTNDGTVPRSPGVVVDNEETVYQLDDDPTLSPVEAELNANVLRVADEPQGRVRQGLANVPVVSGSIEVPVLTLHTIGDLFVPISMERIYAERVAENGASDLLVQRAIRDLDHCAFSPQELAQAFAELVAWVELGVRPAGDDFTDPAAVADPAFGCAFTNPDRTYPPPLSIPPC